MLPSSGNVKFVLVLRKPADSFAKKNYTCFLSGKEINKNIIKKASEINKTGSLIAQYEYIPQSNSMNTVIWRSSLLTDFVHTSKTRTVCYLFS
jgi:hypothetical protein